MHVCLDGSDCLSVRVLARLFPKLTLVCCLITSVEANERFAPHELVEVSMLGLLHSVEKVYFSFMTVIIVLNSAFIDHCISSPSSKLGLGFRTLNSTVSYGMTCIMTKESKFCLILMGDVAAKMCIDFFHPKPAVAEQNIQLYFARRVTSNMTYVAHDDQQVFNFSSAFTLCLLCDFSMLMWPCAEISCMYQTAGNSAELLSHRSCQSFSLVRTGQLID